MRLVADTNIVFSALLKQDSRELEIFQDSNVEIFLPKFLVIEIFKHKEKITRYSKCTNDEILESFSLIFKYCRIFDEQDVPPGIRLQAFEYVKDVDPKDVAFVAAALTLDAKLWSGDKKFIDCLKNKNVRVIQTSDFYS